MHCHACNSGTYLHRAHDITQQYFTFDSFCKSARLLVSPCAVCCSRAANPLHPWMHLGRIQAFSGRKRFVLGSHSGQMGICCSGEIAADIVPGGTFLSLCHI